MLKTPFGIIKLTLDKEVVHYNTLKVPPNSKLYPDVNGAFLLSYNFVSDGKPHALRCVLEGINSGTSSECGERFEAVAIYTKGGKITIGCEGEFGELPESCTCYDFNGTHLCNGIEISIKPHTQDRTFLFGIAWLISCNDNNEVQTWLAADPTINT